MKKSERLREFGIIKWFGEDKPRNLLINRIFFLHFSDSKKNQNK